MLEHYRRFNVQEYVQCTYYTIHKLAFNVVTSISIKTISDLSFDYTATYLYNLLPMHLKSCVYQRFLKLLKIWTEDYIQIVTANL